MYVALALTSVHYAPKLAPIICTKSIVRAVKMAKTAQFCGHVLYKTGDSICIYHMQANVPISPKENLLVFSIALDQHNKKVEAWHDTTIESEFKAKTKPQAHKKAAPKNQT